MYNKRLTQLSEIELLKEYFRFTQEYFNSNNNNKLLKLVYKRNLAVITTRLLELGVNE